MAKLPNICMCLVIDLMLWEAVATLVFAIHSTGEMGCYVLAILPLGSGFFSHGPKPWSTSTARIKEELQLV